MPVVVPANVESRGQLMWPLDENRGIWAMAQVIATEAALFVCLFGSYFYLENNKQRWAIDQPPKLHWAFACLAVVLVSAFVMWLGERQLNLRNYRAARLLLLGTLLLGLLFLVFQGFDYSEHWASLTPYSDSYGSIFYAIESFDALHVIVGIWILLYVLILPRYRPVKVSPYRPYRVAAMYWYFVAIVWTVIVGLMYVMPNVRVYGF